MKGSEIKWTFRMNGGSTKYRPEIFVAKPEGKITSKTYKSMGK
jgi:hypothetical protein